MSQEKTKVLYVCLGNICRSPTAHGIFRQMLKNANLLNQIEVESAGTAAYHIGKPPDPRTIQTAQAHGIDIQDLRAAQVCRQDFHDYDYILAMDQENLDNLQCLRPKGAKAELGKLLDFLEGEHQGASVPDPYYGGTQGFEQVFTLVETGCTAFLKHLKANNPSI